VTRIEIKVTATYPHPVPDTLRVAVRESIEEHLAAYGLEVQAYHIEFEEGISDG
jgi:hypothetical protein